jgi:SAM-dependent MidA family methyltransferase
VDLRRVPAVDVAAIGSEAALVERIRDEIAAHGPMTFARFMERALYEPGLGYYRRAVAGPGRDGDFLTAPETHPIFGRALSRQLDEVWRRLDRPPVFVVREHGAGTGSLAVAILDGLAADGSALLDAIRYQPVEVEAARLETFAGRLAAAGHATRVESGAGGSFTGVVLANEVLDALPVHRVRQTADRLEELFVDWDGTRFVDRPANPSTAALAARLRDDGVQLRDGQLAEICLAVEAWIEEAAAPLERGLLLLVDYGHPATELYGPRRMAGTLMAYAGHRAHDDPLINVGRQDLTAHVDLTAVERAATTAGLERLGLTTQASFLMQLGIEGLLREVQSNPATTAEDYLALRSGLVRLLDPAVTGSFRFMAFGRRWPDGAALAGWKPAQ